MGSTAEDRRRLMTIFQATDVDLPELYITRIPVNAINAQNR